MPSVKHQAHNSCSQNCVLFTCYKYAYSDKLSSNSYRLPTRYANPPNSIFINYYFTGFLTTSLIHSGYLYSAPSRNLLKHSHSSYGEREIQFTQPSPLWF